MAEGMSSEVSFKKALIIGASRGLGRAVALYLPTHVPGLESLTLVSRKAGKLEELSVLVKKGDPPVRRPYTGETLCLVGDMSREESVADTCQLLKNDQFDLVIYCAGGGPHGEFAQKEWKDHKWSLDVNLMTPMRLVHQWLLTAPQNGLKRFVVVGSRIAEKNPDPLASSYAAGKQGLSGFVSSLQSELSESQKSVWLFSPGYMDSEMLPATAHVRHDGTKLMSVETAAQALLRWIRTDGPWHRVL